MITLVGVGHVFDIKKSVREIILSRKPGIVAVELDRARYDALVAENHGTGDAPFTYRLLSHFQSRLARQYGGKPGDEMLAAIDTAKELKVDVAFIDMEASGVFSSIWTRMTFEEKVKLMSAGVFGMFVGKKRVEKELKKFDENSDEYMNHFGQEFPTVKKVLVDQRDQNMAKALVEIGKKYSGVVAIVGDGHIEGISKLLADHGPEVIRLRELRDGSWSRESNRGITVSFTWDRNQG